MTDPNYTHVFFLLDRSGSMQSIKRDTEGGFAAYIEELKRGEGRCRVSFSQFDTHYDHVFHDIDLHDVRHIELQPRGGTALLDAIGRLIHETGTFLAAKPEDQRPGSVVVAIMTDGMENSSREWTHAAIKSLIEEHEEKYSWTFMYMGANQDAIEVGAGLGIQADRTMTYAGANVGAAMTSMATSANRYRAAKAAGYDEGYAKARAAFLPEERDQAMRERKR